MWEPPVDYPASAGADDKYYEWDEDTTSWAEVAENKINK